MDIPKILESKIKALTKYENDINQIIENFLVDNQALVIEFNTEDQLYEKGINSLGVDISDYAPYSEVTIEEKKLKNQPFNRVTLRDEGDFHDSVFIRFDKDGFELVAGDFKTEDLVKKYGSKILGLTEDNLGELLFKYIHPELYEQLIKLLKDEN